MNKILEEVFRNRKYDKEFFKKIDNYEYKDLKNIDKFADKLHEINKTNDLIVILSDFDMDGLMSGVIAYSALSALGFNVALYQSDSKYGYGFSKKTIDKLVDEYKDCKYILTCDQGITEIDSINYAYREKGIEVIVTDHHKQVVKGIDSDLIVVDPMQEGDDYDNKAICGAFVIYQCIMRYVDSYLDLETYENISYLKIFAGLGTISDMMPLLNENRKIVRDAISICRFIYNNGKNNIVNEYLESEGSYRLYNRAFNGLYNIIDKFFELGKLSDPSDIDEDFFGFYLAPMFNSIKRMEENVDFAYSIFFREDNSYYLDRLFELNEKRKEMVSFYMDEINNSHQEYAPYIYLSNAPGGILGLLANKIMEETQLPVIVVSKKDNDDILYSGSGRSPIWYNFNSRANANGFICKGHEGAFGTFVESEEKLEDYYTFLSEDVTKVYNEYLEDIMLSGDEIISYDALLVDDGENLNLINYDDDYKEANNVITRSDISGFIKQMKAFGPYGNSFPDIKIELDIINPTEVRNIGKEANHTKLTYKDMFDILIFNTVLTEEDFINNSYKFSGNFSYNFFNNEKKIQFIAQNIEKSEI